MGGYLNEIQFKGRNCKEAKKWLVEKLPELMKMNFPSDWINPVSQFFNMPQQNLIMITLNVFDPTYQKIEEMMHRTLPHCSIDSVQVLQNINLWRRFQVECEQLEHKLGRKIKTDLLWHRGVSMHKPDQVSKEGFQIVFENDMWGRAIYFANDASYTHNFATKDNGKLHIFLAEVVLGDSSGKLPKQGLVKPPNKQNTSIEFDSVSGEDRNSQVFIVYAPQKCYPRFLVTYH